MHLLVRDTRTLDEDAPAVDLGQSPADVVLLSFSDADLGAMAAAWQAFAPPRPSLRLASLAQLRHPMSVDLYIEQVVAGSRCVLMRLLGGLDYWRYGAEEISAVCRDRAIPLAILPGDTRADARLAEMSTVAPEYLSRLDGYFREGGPANTVRALGLGAHLAGLLPDHGAYPEPFPQHGEYPLCPPIRGERPLAVLVFYRSHLQSGDVAPITAMAGALDRRGLDARALYVASLKAPETARFVAETLRAWAPAVVLNATGFSAREDQASPLDAAGAPVLQLVLAGSAREAWAASSRGLSQSDLAMQVVLPEFDGRLLTTAIGFKCDDETVPELGFTRRLHRPDPDGIALAADRAAGWARLAGTAPAERRIALVLSDYSAPGGRGHAVGLDAIASTGDILRLLERANYDVAGVPDDAAIVQALCFASPTPFLALSRYRALFGTLPEDVREKIVAAWGAPEADDLARDGSFWLRHVAFGGIVVALQPDRAPAHARGDRRARYHDPDLPPCHSYVAFYLWLRHGLDVHAMVHLGAHGTLEWLPGKAAALSAACFPSALTGGLPVIYPFIVNNPGEAAVAKRRLGAVVIGHLTPPLQSAGNHGEAAALERLIDEYAAADGLDRRRTALLRGEILERALAAGLLAEAGVACDAPDDAALARLDAYLCDVKDRQIRDGLHVFGRAPDPPRQAALLRSLATSCLGHSEAALACALDRCAETERTGLLAALDGRFVQPGPAGAPTRGRADVLPTGRNMFAVDPRAVPTRSAVTLAEKAAEAILRRHVQDHGEWPRAMVLDVWGSASMRTGGEEFALALVLMGARPVWDAGSGRVSGVEILPLALLDRPRVDVTLRISGLFRDVFETQILLFDAAVRAIAAREERAEDNPLAASAAGLAGTARRRATLRVFGAAPGSYGAGVAERIAHGAWQDRSELARDYLNVSAAAYALGIDGEPDGAALQARMAEADAFVHPQDHRETDVLDSMEHAAHAGGFAAAADTLGAVPALYHLDTARPDAPLVRTLAEEIAATVRARAANPCWLAGMMRHGYRGGAEIAQSLEALFGFAATLPTRLDAQFDLLFAATLGEPEVDRFLRQNNPAAREGMAARFAEAMRRDLWRPRRNDLTEIR